MGLLSRRRIGRLAMSAVPGNAVIQRPSKPDCTELKLLTCCKGRNCMYLGSSSSHPARLTRTVLSRLYQNNSHPLGRSVGEMDHGWDKPGPAQGRTLPPVPPRIHKAATASAGPDVDCGVRPGRDLFACLAPVGRDPRASTNGGSPASNHLTPPGINTARHHSN